MGGPCRRLRGDGCGDCGESGGDAAAAARMGKEEFAPATNVLETLVELYPQSVPVVERMINWWTRLFQDFPSNSDYAMELAKRTKFLEPWKRVEQGWPPE